MIGRVYNKVKEKVSRIRSWLNKIRDKRLEQYDRVFKWVQFFIPFIGTFTPVLITNNWLRGILEFVLLSVFLVFQWSTYVNRIEAKEKEIQVLSTKLKSTEDEIKKLKEEMDGYTNLFDEDDTTKKMTIAILRRQIDNISGFSHSVSDNIKKISAEIQSPIDARVTVKITHFFQQSLNSLESILSEHYKVQIRSSIKMTINSSKIKTYARGKNNINSRGGEYHCSQLNDKEIDISENYAYEAIVIRGQQFFAEGNLLEIHNKFDPDDVFYCEYGDDYLDIFVSTIVMPIRIPVYEKTPLDQQEPLQEILGILCVDCGKEISEWSAENIKEKRAYHIIAYYADSLAMLVKEYRNASRKEDRLGKI